VYDHVTSAHPSLLIDDDADVGNVSAQVPSDEVAGRVVSRARSDRQRFSLALEKDHQIRNAAVVYVGVGMSE
jgi:hypothetical protein